MSFFVIRYVIRIVRVLRDEDVDATHALPAGALVRPEAQP
jgi:hypothetical protein